MSDLKTFEIAGHEYSYTLHGHAEGLPLSLRLSSTALAGVARGLGSAVEEGDLAQAIGSVADAVAQLLASPDAAKLARAILANTFRDGKPLSSDVEFTRAYQGNWGECYEAIVIVSMGNGFLPGRDSFTRLASRAGIDLKKALSPEQSN